MVLTLIDVIIRLNEQDGDKMAGASVTAHLTRIDADSTTGMVVPEISRGTADINGELTLPLWPNTLGKYDSKYLFTICQLSGKTTTYGPLTLPHLDDNNQPITEIFLSELDDSVIDIVTKDGIFATLAANTGAGLVGTLSGDTVQVELDSKAYSSDLAADGGAGLVGNAAIQFDSVADMLAATWLSVGDIVSSGATVWRVQSLPLSIADFTAISEVYSSDFNGDLAAAFGVVSSGGTLIISGQNIINSKLVLTLSNCRVVGIDEAEVGGNFGYALIDLLTTNNVHFSHIKFNNLYINPAQDGFSSTVASRNSDIINLTFYQCCFSMPNANGNGLSLYVNTDFGMPASNQCHGLTVDNCKFENIGRQACTLMSRSVGAELDLFTGVRFTNNTAINVGSFGDFGMLLSLDGYGSDFNVMGNSIVDCVDIGIEVTKWEDGNLSNNYFSVGANDGAFAPIACEGKRVSIENNICLTPCHLASYLAGAEDCSVKNNRFIRDGSGFPLLLRSSLNNKFCGNHYTNTESNYCLFVDDVEGACTGNVMENETFDNVSPSSFDCVVFSGALTTNNEIREGVYNTVGGGGTARQVSGSEANILRSVYSGKRDAGVTVSDASDPVLTITQYSANYINFTGTLTAQKFIEHPSLRNDVIFSNKTTEQITIRIGGVNKLNLPASTATISRCFGSFFELYSQYAI